MGVRLMWRILGKIKQRGTPCSCAWNHSGIECGSFLILVVVLTLQTRSLNCRGGAADVHPSLLTSGRSAHKLLPEHERRPWRFSWQRLCVSTLSSFSCLCCSEMCHRNTMTNDWVDLYWWTSITIMELMQKPFCRGVMRGGGGGVQS